MVQLSNIEIQVNQIINTEYVTDSLYEIMQIFETKNIDETKASVLFFAEFFFSGNVSPSDLEIFRSLDILGFYFVLLLIFSKIVGIF